MHELKSMTVWRHYNFWPENIILETLMHFLQFNAKFHFSQNLNADIGLGPFCFDHVTYVTLLHIMYHLCDSYVILVSIL